MRRKVGAAVLCLGLAFCGQALAAKQAQPAETTQTTTYDRGRDWGWLGLLGLVGLFGLKRRNETTVVRGADINRPATSTR